MNVELNDQQATEVDADFIKFARKNFYAFLFYIWPQVDLSEGDYIIARLHRFLAKLVQGVFDGSDSQNQAVSVPPQHGKSQLLSVRAVAWILGARPGISVALTGFDIDLLRGFISDIKDITQREDYQEVFPIHPVRGATRSTYLRFSNGSKVQAKSAGSKLTGRRVDWLIVDDPHAGRKEAESPTDRKRVKDWFFGDCLSRLSKKAAVFLIMTRWHPNDLIGEVTSKEYVQKLTMANQVKKIFKVTNLKAISDGFDPLGRGPEEALFPEERPMDFLLGMKAQQPGFEWDSQFQGNPRTASGNQIDLSKIKIIKASELPDGLSWRRGWDLAITESQAADYTAGVLGAKRLLKEKGPGGIDLYELYIRDVKRGQHAWAKMRKLILETTALDVQMYKLGTIGIEGVAGFDAVYSDVKDKLLGICTVQKKNPPRGGKLLRAQGWLTLAEAGRLILVEGSWIADYILELQQFPAGAHDDQVDATSIMWELSSSNFFWD